MKTIFLTKGQSALVDDHWFEYLNQWKWYAQKSREGYRAARRENRHSGLIYMHRVVANTPTSLMCDHVNHNTLDNRECNLRNVTNSQNQLNRKPKSDNVLGEKCIGFDNGLYRVSFYKGKKRVFDKRFSSLDDAKKARDEAVKVFHGEFAYEAAS